MIPKMSKQDKWEIDREMKMAGGFMELCSALPVSQKYKLKEVTF